MTVLTCTELRLEAPAIVPNQIAFGAAQSSSGTNITLANTERAAAHCYAPPASGGIFGQACTLVWITGANAGLSEAITDYTSPPVLTVAAAFPHAIAAGDLYAITVPGGPNGMHWRFRIVTDAIPTNAPVAPMSSPYGNYSGGALQISFDRSLANDWSDEVPVAQFGSAIGTAGPNGDDNSNYLYGSILGIISANTLRSPARPQDWLSWSASHNGTNASCLDVSPQLIFLRKGTVGPAPYSVIGSIQWDIIDSSGAQANLAYAQMIVDQSLHGSIYGHLKIVTAGASYPWNIGGVYGGGMWSDGLWDTGGGSIHARSLAVAGQWVTVP